jgi:8-oxo-dGTP diphosphatase
MVTAHVTHDWRTDLGFVAPAAPWLLEPAGSAFVGLSAVAVPWRYEPEGGLEIALVRRRRRSDWGFPKGSPLPGESLDAAANRELFEEAGIVSRHSAPLANLIYVARSGRTKLASYWLVRAGPGVFRPNREISKLSWLSPAAARVELTHERERAVLGLAVDALGLGLLAG